MARSALIWLEPQPLVCLVPVQSQLPYGRGSCEVRDFIAGMESSPWILKPLLAKCDVASCDRRYEVSTHCVPADDFSYNLLQHCPTPVLSCPALSCVCPRDTNLLCWGVDLVEEHLMASAGIPVRLLCRMR